MDRGRVGYAATGNKFIRDLMIKNRRKEHLHRLKKIQNRAPFSSPATLDNREPVIIEALKSNPRKVALRKEMNIVVERENKTLLKRIGTTLTGPPRITDKMYQDMKKLCQSKLNSKRELYEKAIVDANNRRFFEYLKKVPGCYNVKVWEKDYRKQLFSQKFTRQVTYKRPEGWIDPLLNPIAEMGPPTTKSGNNSPSGGFSRSKSSSHIANIRSMRNSKFKSGNEHKGLGNIIGDTYDARLGFNDEEDQSDEYFDDYYSTNNKLLNPEDREIIVSLEKPLRVILGKPTRPNTVLIDNLSQGSASSFKSSKDYYNGTIRCELIKKQIFVINAVAKQEEPLSKDIEVEAEIRLEDLLELRGIGSSDDLLANPDQMKNFAVGILNLVEIEREADDYSLVLNLADKNDILAIVDQADNLEFGNSGEEKLVITKPECSIPLILNLAENNDLTDANLKETEYLIGNVVVSLLEYDQFEIKADILSNSKLSYKVGKEAISAVSNPLSLTTNIGLPSIIQIDGELLRDYLRNLADNVTVYHNSATKSNSLYVKM